MTVRYLISGLVQGVGFRWFVVREATHLGLHGYTRNLADGRVEVLAHGSEPALKSLELRLERGPRSARVENVEKHEILDDIGEYKSFEAR